MSDTATSKDKQFDDRGYWKKRHADVNSLEASGLQNVGLKANFYIYKMLEEQYRLLLNNIDTDEIKSFLDCGYGDGYFLKFIKGTYPHIQLYGLDSSPAAKEKVKQITNSQNLYLGDLSDFSLEKKFDIVHCFDVLYHILPEKDYRSSIYNLCVHSSKYVILHERFFTKTPIITSPHVRMRRLEYTNQLLNSKGFHLYTEIPSHFISMRLLTYKLNRIAPKFLYNIDKYIARKFPNNLQERFASHTIRVYRKDI